MSSELAIGVAKALVKRRNPYAKRKCHFEIEPAELDRKLQQAHPFTVVGKITEKETTHDVVIFFYIQGAAPDLLDWSISQIDASTIRVSSQHFRTDHRKLRNLGVPLPRGKCHLVLFNYPGKEKPAVKERRMKMAAGELVLKITNQEHLSE
jgi:hypothetical protein